MTGQIPLATFDLNEDVIQAIIDGNMEFAIDQQQYLQGYLPIVFLTLYHDNLNTVGGGLPVYTGPGFVTAENAEQVLDLTGAGTR
jgi:simple sugar transport system substrate-binding protein